MSLSHFLLELILTIDLEIKYLASTGRKIHEFQSFAHEKAAYPSIQAKMKKLTLIALTSIMMAGCYKQDMPSGRTLPPTSNTGNTSGQGSGSGSGNNGNTSTSSYCGHPTKDGTPCKRKVAGGGYCWQHK